MRTRAAVLWGRNEPWSVEDIELDPPREGEVLVRVAAAGLCASDAHLVSGELPSVLPIIGGHEGAGVVEAVGAGVNWVSEGDHVVFGFIPACGRCPACSTGHQNQCDVGAVMGSGLQIADQTSRHHAHGQDLGLMCLLGTFARHTVVSAAQCVPVSKDIPFEVACLAGCAVITGYGSVVYAGETKPGDDVTVIGAGGIGMNAIQAARLVGARRIFAVEPVAGKRELAVRFGATHVAPDIEAAYDLIKAETAGRMSNRVIVTLDVARGDLLHPIMRLTSKLGRVVLTSLAPAGPRPVSVNLFDLTMREKQLVGSLSGSGNPHYDIPRLLALSEAGQLDIAGQITRTYPLDAINDGYRDLRDGRNLRGVLLCDG